MQKPYRAAIFDLDGVLADTARFHYLAWKDIADALDLPLPRRKASTSKALPRRGA
jgi:beta-phosphoglucomutase-like phosphatase (HAD superfamily)